MNDPKSTVDNPLNGRQLIGNPAAVLVIDQDQGQIVQWNSACAELFRQTRPAVIGKKLAAVVPAALVTALGLPTGPLDSNPEPAHAVVTLSIPGAAEPVLICLQKIPLVTAGGQLRNWLVILQVIPVGIYTDGEARQWLRAIEQSPSSVVITDLSGLIEYVNPKFTQLTGYTFAEVCGKNSRILKSGASSVDTYREMWQTISSGGEWHGEFYNKKKNGEFYWESASLSAIRDAQGKLVQYLKVAEDISRRKAAEAERDRLLQETSRLAIHDPLVNVYNRRGFAELFGRIWQNGRRHGHSTGLLIIDVDHFKLLNDSHGHTVGDRVLREFAELITKIARNSDIVGRYGGDEFVIVLPETRPAEIQRFTRRLMEAIHERIFCEKDLSLRATISIGAACSLHVPETQNEAELFILADRALYAAKQEGRDRVCCHWELARLTTGPGAAVAAPAADGATAVPSCRGRIIVAEDDPTMRHVITEMLESENYAAAGFATSQETITALAQAPTQFDVVLVDLRLGHESGFDLLDQLGRLDDALVKVVITGAATTDNAILSLRRGAFDFIQKPFTMATLSTSIHRAMDQRRLLLENRRYRLHLQELVRQKSADLSQTLARLQDSYSFTLKALSVMLDTREGMTGSHSVRVSRIARLVAVEMGLADAAIDDIERGALLHDIGKIAVPDGILLKSGRLTPAEREIMNRHPQIGFDILKENTKFQQIAEIVYSHHEKFDGSGYPRGLTGAAICLGARIFAVVDTYDTIRAGRLYCNPRSSAEAVAEIGRHRGTQFDPEAVAAFVRCVPQIEQLIRWDDAPRHPHQPPQESHG